MPVVTQATGGIGLTRYTTHIVAGLKQKKQRGLPFANGLVFPYRNDIGLADTAIVEQYIEGGGTASYLSEVANDIPLVGASTGEDKYSIETIVSGFKVTYQELARANRTLSKVGGGTVQNTMATVGRRVIMEKINTWIHIGDADKGVTGAYNNVNVPVDDNSFNPYTSTDFQEHLDFIGDGIVTPFRNQASLNQGDFVMFVPDTYLSRIQSLINTGNGKTVYETAMANFRSRGLMGMMPLNESAKGSHAGSLPANIGTSGKDRILVMVQDTEVAAVDGSGLQSFPQVQQATGFLVPMYQVIGEPIVSIANCLRYVDIITKP